MTCYPFWNKTTKRVLNIGTMAGGQKSTGYTFKNSDKSSVSPFLQQDRELKVSYEN
jgi:lycopene beta-cyclase